MGETVATRLLGGAVTVTRLDDGIEVRGERRSLPVRTDYDHLWTSFGAPARDIFALPEAGEADRRDYDTYRALATNHLPEEAFASAWATGQVMTQEQAIARAMRLSAPHEQGRTS